MLGWGSGGLKTSSKFAIKQNRILFLAILFFLSGLFFFLSRSGIFSKSTAGEPSNIRLTPSAFGLTSTPVLQADHPLVLTNFPAPETFRHFVYKPGSGRKLQVDVNCQAEYYTVMIFSAAVDYRQQASAARYNNAESCPHKGALATNVNLTNLNLLPGEYYVVRAQQGATGAWFDPY